MKLSLHDGDGREYASIDLGKPDNNGILNEAELTYGHLFIAIDGQEYGSLAFSEVIPGQAHIELGAYAPVFDQWAPQNPLTEPEGEEEVGEMFPGTRAALDGLTIWKQFR